MFTTLVALLLLAASIDPRLEPPLRLLAEIRDRHGEPVGAEYATLPQSLGLTLRVAELPPRAGGHYQPRTRTLTMAETLLQEDPRVMAVGLVHELRHAADLAQDTSEQGPADCLGGEVRAFEAQAIVAQAFWPDALPRATEWERGIAATVQMHEQGGADAIRTWLEGSPAYRRMCAPLRTGSPVGLTLGASAGRVSAR